MSIERIEGEHGEIQIVADHTFVQGLTSEGWVLVAILEELTSGTHYEDHLPDPNKPGYYHGMPNESLARGHSETQHKYVLAKSRDETVIEQVATIERLRHELEEQSTTLLRVEAANSELGEAQGKHADTVERLEGLATSAKTVVDRLTEEARDVGLALKKAQKAQRKAEKHYKEHMTTMWSELGAAKMRELLGPDVESPIPLPKAKSDIERIDSGDVPG